jgi:hypothetical protein
MNSMVATEAVEKPGLPPLLETWEKNERMRHVPSVEWMTRKLDSDLRPRIEKLYAPFPSLPADDPRHAPIEGEIRALCRAIDRLADSVRHIRQSQPPQDLLHRIFWSIGQAVSALLTLDANVFGHRYPFHTFERSKAEPVYAALLVVIAHIDRLTSLVRTIDPSLDERLCEGLVQLQEPLRREPMVAGDARP